MSFRPKDLIGSLEFLFDREIKREPKSNPDMGGARCTSFIHHGAGHQSKTRCELTGPHEIHQATFGEFNKFQKWDDAGAIEDE